LDKTANQLGILLPGKSFHAGGTVNPEGLDCGDRCGNIVRTQAPRQNDRARQLRNQILSGAPVSRHSTTTELAGPLHGVKQNCLGSPRQPIAGYRQHFRSIALSHPQRPEHRPRLELSQIFDRLITMKLNAVQPNGRCDFPYQLRPLVDKQADLEQSRRRGGNLASLLNGHMPQASRVEVQANRIGACLSHSLRILWT
jgi:hypothetical protein